MLPNPRLWSTLLAVAFTIPAFAGSDVKFSQTDWCTRTVELSADEAAAAHDFMVQFLATHPGWRDCEYPTERNYVYRINPKGAHLYSYWEYADEEGEGVCGPNQDEVELSKNSHAKKTKADGVRAIDWALTTSTDHYHFETRESQGAIKDLLEITPAGQTAPSQTVSCSGSSNVDCYAPWNWVKCLKAIGNGLHYGG